jgi:hypothetical protein
MSRELGHAVRVAMVAYHDRERSSPAAVAFAAELDRSLVETTCGAAGPEAEPGDALRMLHHLGIDRRRLSPATCRMVADAEAMCLRCPCAARCGAFLRQVRRGRDAPPFCPNGWIFRQLTERCGDA